MPRSAILRKEEESTACHGGGHDSQKSFAAIGLIFILPAITAAQEGIKFPVAASSKVLGFAPLWVASGKGFLKGEGLDAEVTAIRGTASTMQALVSDSIYVALAANDGAIGLVEKGMDFAMIAGGAKSTHMIMGGKGFRRTKICAARP